MSTLKKGIKVLKNGINTFRFHSSVKKLLNLGTVSFLRTAESTTTYVSPFIIFEKLALNMFNYQTKDA